MTRPNNGLPPLCKKCDTRHWNIKSCAEHEDDIARQPVPTWRPHEGFHDPGFGVITDPSSFSQMGKARRV